MRINTEQDFDGYWHASDENYDGAPDAGSQCVGFGKTEALAIADYWDNAKDFYADRCTYCDGSGEGMTYQSKCNLCQGQGVTYPAWMAEHHE